jgi:hypothetical protein
LRSASPTPPRKRLLRFEGFIAPSEMPIGEMGLFTMNDLYPNGDKRIVFNENPFDPVLSYEYVGTYTGKVMERLPKHPLGLTAVTFQDSGIIIDAEPYGGIMYLSNQAHAPFKRVISAGTVGNKQYMYAEAFAIKGGGELYWPYNAITDDLNDSLLKVKCACGCGGKLIRFEA